MEANDQRTFGTRVVFYTRLTFEELVAAAFAPFQRGL
jgi:hypothetical protein